MKFINNSIDSEYLQDSISDADLEKQMANCEAKSEVLNGHHSDGIKIPGKPNMERVTKLTNGVHGKSGSPIKCNGDVNGLFVEDEEDFNLVFEDDSSEGGESPSKKIDDDSISAPQIVQEIEDLLGITSKSAGIEEELNNLDGTESIEDNLDNDEDIEEVFEEISVNKDEECKGTDSEKIQRTEETQKLPDKTTETTECDTSHMNLVFDEVEVGMENGDLSEPNESNSIDKPDNTECKVGSTTEAYPEKAEDFIISETKNTTCRKDDTKSENSKKLDVSVESTIDEMPITQNSSLSENSEEWMVLDATETSDEEKLSGSQESSLTVKSLDHDLNLEKSPQSKDEIQNETVCSLSTPNNNETVHNLPLAMSSESKELKCDTDCTLSEPHDKIMAEPKDTCERTSNTSLLCDGDGVRKRCASLDEEEVELKKPKLEDQSCLVESSSPVLKRPSAVTTENENKRTKLSETLDDEDCQVNKKSDNVRDQIENKMIIENDSDKDSQTTDFPIKSTLEEEPLLDGEDNLSKNLVTKKLEEIPSNATSCSKTSNINDDVKSPTLTEQSQEKLISDVSAKDNDQGNKIDSVSPEEFSSSLEDSETTHKENEHSLITTSRTQHSKEIIADSKILGCEEPENKPQDCGQKSDENKENVSSSSSDTSKEEVGFKLDDLSSITNKEPPKSDQAKKISGFSMKTENKITEPAKTVSFTKELSTSIKELEKSLIKSGQEKSQDSKDLKDTESKKMTNLDFAIERVVEKARIQTEKKVPILKKFHKDQLKKLKRSELEDIVVSKICEAVTYKSEIGQMRLRTQTLEETNEIWRKKVQQIEKQNRELEMVLKRFLSELGHIKRENQNKVPMPIKVTRSVGLQVVLASSMHGALVSSRSKMNNEASQQQQESAKSKQSEKEKGKEPVKATTFMPPVSSQSTLGRGRGRPAKGPIATLNSRPSTPQAPSPKITPPTTPSKPANVTPVKTIQTPSKSLEVIDLTDKEERAKSTSQPPPPVGGSIRVAPSTQVCFVQPSAASTPPQQPLYLVQKAGQRPQFLVATSSASPQRPISVSRPPPALALPVFRAGGQLIPVQTSPQVGVKTNTITTQTAVARQVPSTLRLQQQSPSVSKHPAPLPSAPATSSKPGMKAPPPKPQLKIAKTSNGIMLSWSMSLTKDMAEMQSYQLYAYQEGNQPPSTGLWKKVGDVKALPLPMACTLTQFIEGHKYHFAVRAVDTHGRIGPFSTPSSILLTK